MIRFKSTLLLGAFLLFSAIAARAQQEPKIISMGSEENCGPNGRISSIATDSKNQPHIVADGGTMAFMYDRIGGTWRNTDFDSGRFGSSQYYNPSLVIDPVNDRSYCVGIMFGRLVGLGCLTRTDVANNPSAPAFKVIRLQGAWDVGNVTWDPGRPNEFLASGANGYWQRHQFNAGMPGLSEMIASGVMFAGQGGEKNHVEISHAGNVAHPDGTSHGIWHSCIGGWDGWSSSYQNSLRFLQNKPTVTWLEFSVYRKQNNDGTYVDLCADNKDPNVAYMVCGVDQGVVMNIWNGSRMLFNPSSVLIVSRDAAGYGNGLRRYSPQLTPAKNGGAWVTWTTSGGLVKVRYISSEGSLGTEEYTVGAGSMADITTDKQGNLHVSYNNGGIRYRKLTVSGSVEAKAKPGDFDGDGLVDIAVWRDSDASWYILKSSGGATNINWGATGDLPVPSDYNGDGTTEIAVFRPTDGTWYIRGGATTPFGMNGDTPVEGDYNGDKASEIAVYRASDSSWNIAGVVTNMIFGLPGDLPEPADYDGDGIMDIGVYRPSNATWYYFSSKSKTTVEIPWGLSTDLPVPADYNGDKTNEIAVYRPSNGTWYIVGMNPINWGASGDIPVPGRFTMTNKSDIAVFRPGTGQWWIRKSIDGSLLVDRAPVPWGAAGDTPVPFKYNGRTTTDVVVYRSGWWYVRGVAMVQWGVLGDIPVPADYDGDGTNDVAVYRPSNGTWYYWSSASTVTVSTAWGASTDKPVPADYNGDGHADIAVYRPSDGGWYIQGMAPMNWGTATDIPMPDDYNGDSTAEIAVFRPSDAKWYIRDVGTVSWGIPGDVPVRADFDNDKTNDFGVFRPSNGTWYYWSSASNVPVSLAFGAPGDIPLTGDFDGDGLTDKALFRSGDWYILQSSDGQLVKGSPPVWGLSTDMPIGGR